MNEPLARYFYEQCCCQNDVDQPHNPPIFSLIRYHTKNYTEKAATKQQFANLLMQIAEDLKKAPD